MLRYYNRGAVIEYIFGAQRVAKYNLGYQEGLLYTFLAPNVGALQNRRRKENSYITCNNLAIFCEKYAEVWI
jgi:hypothetical protein